MTIGGFTILVHSKAGTEDGLPGGNLCLIPCILPVEWDDSVFAVDVFGSIVDMS